MTLILKHIQTQAGNALSDVLPKHLPEWEGENLWIMNCRDMLISHYVTVQGV